MAILGNAQSAANPTDTSWSAQWARWKSPTGDMSFKPLGWAVRQAQMANPRTDPTKTIGTGVYNAQNLFGNPQMYAQNLGAIQNRMAQQRMAFNGGNNAYTQGLMGQPTVQTQGVSTQTVPQTVTQPTYQNPYSFLSPAMQQYVNYYQGLQRQYTQPYSGFGPFTNGVLGGGTPANPAGQQAPTVNNWYPYPWMQGLFGQQDQKLA